MLTFTAGDEFVVNQVPQGDQTAASITRLKGGGFVVTWRSDDHQGADTDVGSIKGAVFDAAGNNISGELLINEFTQSEQAEPTVTALDTGGFVVGWASVDQQDADPGYGIKARVFDERGLEVVSEFQANEIYDNTQSQPAFAALKGGGFVGAWYSYDHTLGDTSETAINVRVFSDTGVETVSEFLANQYHDLDELNPTVTGLEGGGFVLAWQSNDTMQPGDAAAPSVKARIFAADGTEVKSEFIVNSFSTGTQREPSIVALKGGGFVAVWSSGDDMQPADQDSFAVKARVFDASGTETVAEFVVNQNAGGSQGVPSVTALEGGRFVVVWGSGDQQDPGDQSGNALKARVFDSAGNALTDEFLVDQHGAGNQEDPVVAARPDGGFVISWSSSDQAQMGDQAGSAIKARIFALDNAAPVAGDDALKSGNEDKAKIIHTGSLLANDSDADGEIPTIASVGNAVGGTVALDLGSGDITFTPDKDFNGLASFTYTIEDQGNGGLLAKAATATASFIVAAVNDAPAGIHAAAALEVAEFAANGKAVGKLVADDVDDVAFAYTMLDDAGGRFTIDALGVVRVKDGLSLDYEQAKSHFVTVAATDPEGLAVTKTFAVHVGNQAPETVTGDARANVLHGGAGSDHFRGLGGDDGLVGAGGDDLLAGGGGDDALSGKGGRDVVRAGKGADAITGGRGADRLYGGKDGDADVFLFKGHDSGVAAKAQDHVFQFHAGTDLIDLTALEVKWKDITLGESGKNVAVSIDTHGSSKADMIIDVLHVGHLNQADFIL